MIDTAADIAIRSGDKACWRQPAFQPWLHACSAGWVQASIVLALLQLCVVQPLYEEVRALPSAVLLRQDSMSSTCDSGLPVQVLFRGFLLPCLAKQMQLYLAVLGSAIAFSATHWIREDFVPLLLFGTVWGGLYAAFGSLFVPLLLHCFWNLWAFARLAGWLG